MVYGQNHPQFQWVQCQNGSIPPNAVQGGCESDGRPLYVARREHEGSIVPGKAGQHIKGVLISYDGKEINHDTCEVLCGPASHIQWKECYGRLQVNGWVPMECGRETDGTELFIAKTKLNGGEVLGKVGTHMANGMVYGYDCKEKSVKDNEPYYVLAIPN